MRPFLKWVGGKSRQLPYILENLPHPLPSRVVVPFLGGGSVFFALGIRCGVVGDINPHLAHTWKMVSYSPRQVRLELDLLFERYFPTTEEGYYLLRRRWNQFEWDGPKKAAAFILLNRTGYRGLWRENQAGELNTPFGQYSSPRLPPLRELQAVSEFMTGSPHGIVHVGNYDFTQTLDCAYQFFSPSSAFFYFDPPYDGTFSGYTQHGFGWEDQKRLHAACMALHEQGGTFMVSSSATERIVDLWKDFHLSYFQTRYVMNEGEARSPVREAIITNYPQSGPSQNDITQGRIQFVGE